MGASLTRKRKRQELEEGTQQNAEPGLKTTSDNAGTTGRVTQTLPTRDEAHKAQTHALDSGNKKQARSERRSRRAKLKDAGKEPTSHKAGRGIDDDGQTPSRKHIKSVDKIDVEEDGAPDGEPGTVSKQLKKRKKSSDQSVNDEPTAPSKLRFICFIGNLPYNATTQQIETHFASLLPFTIRHGTDKQTGRSKGFAFLEFDGYDKMKTCLKLYHHSIFNPESQDDETSKVGESNSGNKTKPKARRINVELTAGGGGKSKERKAKIKVRNQKLEDERARRFAKERIEQEEAAKQKAERPATGANVEDDRGAIHPSRMARVQR